MDAVRKAVKERSQKLQSDYERRSGQEQSVQQSLRAEAEARRLEEDARVPRTKSRQEEALDKLTEAILSQIKGLRPAPVDVPASSKKEKREKREKTPKKSKGELSVEDVLGDDMEKDTIADGDDADYSLPGLDKTAKTREQVNEKLEKVGRPLCPPRLKYPALWEYLALEYKDYTAEDIRKDYDRIVKTSGEKMKK